MFNTNKTIIYITRQNIKTASVTLGKQPKVNNLAEVQWDSKNLAAVLQKLKTTLKLKKVRILLDDELSYTELLEAPEGEKIDRTYVANRVAETIPEKFNDNEWDFREVRVKKMKNEKEKMKKKILVFAPIKEFYEKLKEAVVKTDLKVEAIEPAQVAKIRNKNPIIGLALKKDLKGKDEKVLNLDMGI